MTKFELRLRPGAGEVVKKSPWRVNISPPLPLPFLPPRLVNKPANYSSLLTLLMPLAFSPSVPPPPLPLLTNMLLSAPPPSFPTSLPASVSLHLPHKRNDRFTHSSVCTVRCRDTNLTVRWITYRRENQACFYLSMQCLPRTTRTN